MQHRHMSGTVAVTQAKFEKLTGNDEANHQVGKAAGILHLLCRNPASLCRNALAVGPLLLLQVGVDDSWWSHLCCVRISPEGRSVSAGWGVWVLFPALLSAIVWTGSGASVWLHLSCQRTGKGIIPGCPSALEPGSIPGLHPWGAGSCSVPAVYLRGVSTTDI